MCAKHIQSNAQERQTDRLKCQSVKISFMDRLSGGNRFDSPMNLNLEPNHEGANRKILKLILNLTGSQWGKTKRGGI